MINFTRLENKPSLPRYDKETFLQPGMLPRGHGEKLNELYTSKSKYPDSIERVNISRDHLESFTNINESGRSIVPHSSSRGPFNPMINAS